MSLDGLAEKPECQGKCQVDDIFTRQTIMLKIHWSQPDKGIFVNCRYIVSAILRKFYDLNKTVNFEIPC